MREPGSSARGGRISGVQLSNATKGNYTPREREPHIGLASRLGFLPEEAAILLNSPFVFIGLIPIRFNGLPALVPILSPARQDTPVIELYRNLLIRKGKNSSRYLPPRWGLKSKRVPDGQVPCQIF